MKRNRIFENFLIIICFLAVMAFPWTAHFFGVENNLSGAEEKVEFSLENLEKFIIQNFPGREILVRTKNQMLYSLFDVSPNSSITKVDDTLFSTETLNYYFHDLHAVTDEQVKTLIDKLQYLDAICKETNKKFVVIMTPSKPRYFNGLLPFADDIILAYQQGRAENPYNMFKEAIEKTDIHFFDSIEYIDNNKELIVEGKVPLFHKSAHHWSNYKGNLVGIGLRNFLVDKVKLVLPELELKVEPSKEAIYPDSDLFDVLNIYDKPNERFYKTEVIFKSYINEELDFLIQGGSFLGGFLFPYLTIGFQNKVFHIENKACIYDHYSENLSFESYDELNEKLNILDELKNMDVVILEINELNVYNATFGFLDYLLENKEKF